MKKLFTLTMLLLCAVVGAKGETETISVNSSKSWEGSSLFSVSVANSSMQSGYCKWTKGNDMTINNNSSKTITNITITYTEQGYSPSNSNKTYNNQMSVTTGTLNAKASTTTTTWSGSTSATSFVINWSSGGWDLRVVSVAITYADGKTPSSFALTSETEVEVAIDGTSQITCSNNAGTVTYTSADEGVAEVSASGLITAKAGGKTTISVVDPGSASVSGATKSVTVLVPYPCPSAADSYILNQDTYAFANSGNTKYYFTNGFTMIASYGGELQNGGLAKSKKYGSRTYTIYVPSNVTITFGVFTARSNYGSDKSAANWGTLFGTDYSATALPYSNEDPAEKDVVIESPSAGGTLVFTPNGNQWQAIIELYTVAYGAKHTVSYVSGDGTGSMSSETHRAYASFTLPSSTFTPPADKGFDGWLCSADGVIYADGANYTMTDENTTFTAQYGSAEGKTLIKVTLNGGTSATVTGAIGGTADVNVQNDKKFGSNHYAGFTLAGTNTFKTGDIINVNIATVASGAGTIAIYDTDKTTVLYNTNTKGSVGDNRFSLPAECNGKSTLYICRTSDNGWNAFVNFIEVSRPVSKTISAAGYATFCSKYPLDFTGSGVKAYIATIDGNSVKFTEVTSVPANTGVLLKGEAGEKTINVAASSTDVSANELIGVLTNTPVSAEAAFVLMNGAKGVGFYKNANAFTVGANTAYLPANLVSGARMFIGFDDEEEEVTGIRELNSSANKGAIYNMNGVRVEKAKKGLYIKNGKKIFVK